MRPLDEVKYVRHADCFLSLQGPLSLLKNAKCVYYAKSKIVTSVSKGPSLKNMRSRVQLVFV